MELGSGVVCESSSSCLPKPSAKVLIPFFLNFALTAFLFRFDDDRLAVALILHLLLLLLYFLVI